MLSRSTFAKYNTSGEIAVEIKNVTKGFGENVVLQEFSLEIQKGEVMCLLGANGSGKTTLINVLTGLTEMDDEGDVIINLENNSRVSLRDNKELFRSYIRLCQQNDFLFEEMTGEEHLKLICKLRGITDAETIEDQIDERSHDVSLDSQHMKKRVKFLSPGARRKLSIAMSLIGEGKLLILDEPTSNLDLRSREKIW